MKGKRADRRDHGGVKHTSVYMTMYEIDNTSLINALVARKNAGLDVQAILDKRDGEQDVQHVRVHDAQQRAHPGRVVEPDVHVHAREDRDDRRRDRVDHDDERQHVIAGSTTASTWPSTPIRPTSRRPPRCSRRITRCRRSRRTATSSSRTATRAAGARESDQLGDHDARCRGRVGVQRHQLERRGPGGRPGRAARRHGPRDHRQLVARRDLDRAGQERRRHGRRHRADLGQRHPGPTRTFTQKAIVVDCTTTGCARGLRPGSENFSGGSLGYNRELGVIFDNATELLKVKTAINTLDFANGVAQ